MVANIDLAPTFAELAGMTAPGAEGMSLMPLLRSDPVTWRDDLLIEHLQYKDKAPSYCAVRSKQDLFVTYNSAEQEFYDLTADPYELTNQIGNSAYAETVAARQVRDKELCTPPPPGFVWPYDALASKR